MCTTSRGIVREIFKVLSSGSIATVDACIASQLKEKCHFYPSCLKRNRALSDFP